MSATSEDLKVVRAIADYQFGPGVGEKLFPDGCEVKRSASGTLRTVKMGGALLCTFGRDSLINLARAGAERLAQVGTDKYLVASEEAADFVKRGRSLFAKHVKKWGNFFAGEEVVIISEKGELLGWGRAMWSSREISLLSGVAVVRQRN